MKLLLAEDDLLQRKVLERVLSRAGHDVETVTDGLKALERVLSGHFHFLITDWDMPGMDGATLCQRVRAAELPDYIYILMLTGHTTEADLLAAFDAGADDYVKKPASEAELLARVKAGCRLIESERSLRAALTQVHQLSVTDSLTTVYNRRYLNEQLPREIERAQRYGRSLSIVMADLDGFKQINDRHGHGVGDEVLKCFADLLKSSVRVSSDWIARYGGEEFVVVLPEVSLAEAAAVAEKIRCRCNSTPLHTPSGPHRVTASFGVASSPAQPVSQISHASPVPALSAETLLRHADDAMYRSKRAGRNCVSLEEPNRNNPLSR
jgi:two-component system cell cycle response regulator